MKRNGYPTSFMVRLFMFLIFVVLVSIGVIQFGWFSRSATAEIRNVYRSTSSVVLQAAAREFQRYGSMIGDAGRSYASESGQSTSDSVEAYLANLYDTYGPEGDIPHLLLKVGYAENKAGAVILENGSDPSDNWAVRPDFSIPELPLPINDRRPSWDQYRISMDRNEADGPLYLVVPFGEDGRYVCVFTLDVDGFHESYIVPAVASALPHYEMDWETAPGRALAGTMWSWSEGTFSFNPLRGLLALGSPSKDELLISVPRFMTNFHGPYEADRGGGENGAASPPDPTVPVVVPLNSNDFRRSQDRMFRLVRVSIDGGSLARSIERRLSLNWLGAMTLLLGVALAFVQVLLQMNKLRIIRLREREFVASVTHELRTPLTVIQSAADNLVTGVVPADRLVRYGNLIIDQSKRLGNMIEEMLLFSRVEGRTMQSPVHVPVAVHALIGDVRAAVEPLAEQAGIGIVWDTGSTNASCIGDAETIRLILSNLIANAVHHAYSGEKKGRVRVIVKSALPGKLILQVEDDGRGIAPSETKRVFEPFYRDRVSRENHEKGSGLGLFLAAGKARIAGGSIRLESPYHRVDGTKRPGCRFIAELPFAPMAETEAEKGNAHKGNADA